MPPTNTPYSLGNDSGGGLSPTANNLQASVANNAAAIYSAGVAA